MIDAKALQTTMRYAVTEMVGRRQFESHGIRAASVSSRRADWTQLRWFMVLLHWSVRLPRLIRPAQRCSCV